MPSWVSSIDDYTLPMAVGVAVLLSDANPKNLGPTIAAVASIISAGLDRAEEIVVLLVLVVIASLTVAVPALPNLVLGERVKPGLESLKGRLAQYDSVLVMVLLQPRIEQPWWTAHTDRTRPALSDADIPAECSGRAVPPLGLSRSPGVGGPPGRCGRRSQ